MNFRAAIRTLAVGEISEDQSMDASQMGGDYPGERSDWQPGIDTDGQDPASPGGPSPFNAGEPERGEPVATDPLWHDPEEPSVQGTDMPHIKGPNLNAQTLHNARRDRYAAKERVR